MSPVFAIFFNQLYGLDFLCYSGAVCDVRDVRRVFVDAGGTSSSWWRRSKMVLLVGIGVLLVAAIVGAAVFLTAGSSDDDDGSSGSGDSPGGGPPGVEDYSVPSVPSEAPSTTVTTTMATTTTTTTTPAPKPFEVACNYSLMADANGGEFTSENYPKKYRKLTNTTWCIRTLYGSCIKLEFLDFEVEEKGKISNDYVEIFDGGSKNDKKLGHFFTKKRPPPVTSTVPMMTVYFFTDMGKEEKGFKAKYTSVPCTGSVAGE